MSLLSVENVVKEYRRGAERFRAVDDLSLAVEAGDVVAVSGRSGSGKTTLLTLVAGLLTPTAGTVRLLGTDLRGLSDRGRCEFRNRHIGFVPQGQSLLANLDVYDNIRLPHDLARRDGDIAGRVDYLLERLGLARLRHRRPAQLSGGEMRRVAIARALVNQPEIILADEPTGDLDNENIGLVMDTLLAAREQGATVVFSTHENEAARHASRLFTMDGGRLALSRPA